MTMMAHQIVQDSRSASASPVEAASHVAAVRPIERPVRVCVLAPSLDLVGGQARQAERLLKGLEAESSVEVGFIPHNPRLPGPLRLLQRIKYVRTIVTSLVYWSIAAARLWRYDVVHVYSASYYSYLLSVLPIIALAKLYRKPVLLNYHSGEAEDHLQNWRTAIPTIRWADLIVVPSGYLVEVFGRFGLAARVIPNVVELGAFRFRERSPIRPAFLTSRLFEPLYNVQCVLRAFAVVQRRFPEASLTVAGDGSMRPRLEQLAVELGLRHTRFVGRVSSTGVADLYEAADVYMMAPNIDNMPVTIIECMASGLPVVTTDAGGIPFIVRHDETALIVTRDDHEALAAQAIRLLEHESLATRLARNGRAECARYTWPMVRQAWLEAYHELAAHGDSRRPAVST